MNQCRIALRAAMVIATLLGLQQVVSLVRTRKTLAQQFTEPAADTSRTPAQLPSAAPGQRVILSAGWPDQRQQGTDVAFAASRRVEAGHMATPFESKDRHDSKESTTTISTPSLLPTAVSGATIVSKCDHTAGGPFLTVDTLGVVCPPSLLGTNGCCNATARTGAVAEMKQYTCDGCDLSSQCCAEYEACVSCCLRPAAGGTALQMAAVRRRPHSAALLKHLQQKHSVGSESVNSFKLCCHLCRHDSRSTVHENTYTSSLHHCFGTDPPPPGVGKPGAPSKLHIVLAPGMQPTSTASALRPLSCTEVCRDSDPPPGWPRLPLQCHETSLEWLNTCAALSHYSGDAAGGCPHGCQFVDQAYAPAIGSPQSAGSNCLLTMDYDALNCDQIPPSGARRLCPCRQQM
eukprot:SAG31_NODE_3858_length_3815_cov_2.457212_1_plen_403_part_00